MTFPFMTVTYIVQIIRYIMSYKVTVPYTVMTAKANASVIRNII